MFLDAILNIYVASFENVIAYLNGVWSPKYAPLPKGLLHFQQYPTHHEIKNELAHLVRLGMNLIYNLIMTMSRGSN